VVIVVLEVKETLQRRRQRGVYDKKQTKTEAKEEGNRITRELVAKVALAEVEQRESQEAYDDLCGKYTPFEEMSRQVAGLNQLSERRTELRHRVRTLITAGDKATDEAMDTEDRNDIREVLNSVKLADDKLEGTIKSALGDEAEIRRTQTMRSEPSTVKLSGPFDSRGQADHPITDTVLRSVRLMAAKANRSTILRICNKGGMPLLHKVDEVRSGAWVERWTQPASEQLYHFGFALQIPARSEVMAVLKGRGLPRISGVEAELRYETEDGEFQFLLRVRNPLAGERHCSVTTQRVERPVDSAGDAGFSPKEGRHGGGQVWWVAQVVSDQAENSEVTFTIEMLTGSAAEEARDKYNEANLALLPQREVRREGYLSRAEQGGLSLSWVPRYFLLSSRFLLYYPDKKKRDQAVDRPLRRLDLDAITHLSMDPDTAQIIMGAARRGKTERHRLRAEGPHQVRVTQEWFSAIQDQMTKHKKLLERQQGVASPPPVPARDVVRAPTDRIPLSPPATSTPRRG
jgi:hypothetical protein